MMDKELKLNASGYYDEPCYKAITASPKAGEIWVHNQSGAYMLVMANVNGVCPTLRLNEVEKEGCIPVTCRDIMFTNPAFMGYVFETNLSQYVKSVKGDEFKAVKQKCAEVLGIPTVSTYCAELEKTAADMLEEHTTRDKLKAEYDELLAECKALKEKLKEEQGACTLLIKREEEKADIINSMSSTLSEKEKLIITLNESLEKANRTAASAGIYKEMYMTLLDKVISMKGEA